MRYRWPLKVFKKKTYLAWNPYLLRHHSVQRLFSKFNPLFVLLTLQIINISRSGWIWHRLWNLLTINLKNNSFHNSVDWAELYLQVYIPSQLGKIFRYTVLNYWEMYLWNSTTFGKIWSLISHVEQPPSINLPPKIILYQS